MNVRLVALCIAFSCLAASACIAKVDQKPLPLAPATQMVSEKDVLGDWQTQGEGWRIILNPNHVAAVYFEGYGEVGPFPATWKLVGNDVVVSNATSHAAPLKGGYFKYIGSNLMLISYKDDFVLLPRKELSVAEKHGFVMALCLWRSAQKSDRGKY